MSAATSLSCLVKRSRKQRRDATSAARRIIIAIIRCSRQSEAPRKSRPSRRPEERRDCVSIRYQKTARASIAGTDTIPILFFFLMKVNVSSKIYKKINENTYSHRSVSIEQKSSWRAGCSSLHSIFFLLANVFTTIS